MLFPTGTKAVVSGAKGISGLTKLKLLTVKHAPEIMAVGGAVLIIGGCIWACKQSIKAHDILEQASSDLEDIDSALKEAADPNKKTDPYSEEDARKDRRIIFAKTGVELVKTYGPAALAIAAGLGLMLGGHKILFDRNTALTVALSNAISNYKSYRKRVEERLGTDEEKLLASGAKFKDIVSKDPETGEDILINSVPVIDNGADHSVFARLFDEANKNWSRNPGANLTFLRSQQQFANQKLRAQGYLFLSEVYEMLGFPETSDSRIYGWLYDPNNEVSDLDGDNIVDFGIYKLLNSDQAKRDFINGYEPCIWLDFNVDGVMYDLI